jgi:hypothetical protein
MEPPYRPMTWSRVLGRRTLTGISQPVNRFIQTAISRLVSLHWRLFATAVSRGPRPRLDTIIHRRTSPQAP